MRISPEREAALQAIWYGGRPPGLGLRALALLYRVLRGLTLLPWWLRLRRPQVFDVPVVVVGNLTVGGTGKTPLVIALVEALRARGVGVGVVSRGYGRHTRGVHLVDRGSRASDVGDEPLLIARRTRAPVAVGEDRVAALKRLIGVVPLDLVIADDGLEHHALGRAAEIVVIDGSRGFGNGLLLPAGPLRAPRARLRGVLAEVWNGAPPPGQPAAPCMRIVPTALRPLGGGPAQALADWRGRRAHAVAGTGNPARVFETVRGLGIEVIEHPLPDHSDYREGPPSFDDGLPVITTEKDAVKLAPRADWYVLETSAELPQGLVDALLQALKLEID